jgi:hypothetical protein
MLIDSWVRPVLADCQDLLSTLNPIRNGSSVESALALLTVKTKTKHATVNSIIWETIIELAPLPELLNSSNYFSEAKLTVSDTIFSLPIYN